MIYFDNAATSRFKPSIMGEKMIQCMYNSSNFSRASHSDALNLATDIALFRERVLDCLKAPRCYETIYTPSCTDSLNLAIFGFARTQEKPFHIITTAFDHNSTLRPINQLANMEKARYTIIYPNDNLDIPIEDIEKSISPQTKLIVVNHMSNVTGSILDLEKVKALAKAHGIALLVDCAQSIGHLPISLENGIDFLAIPAHKGLHGPQGVGLLIANKDIPIFPIKFGGSGINSESLEQPAVYPDGFEVGTLNAPGIIGFRESFDYTMSNFQLINNKIQNLSAYLYRKLVELKDIKIYSKPNSPVTSISYKDFSSAKLSNYLNFNEIATRAGLHCAPMAHSYLGTSKRGLTRISLGFNNNLNEIDYLIEMLTRLNRIN